MRFIDEAKIRVASGAGGDGCMSFRREKFVPFGGPDGGSGGKGGDVVLVATTRRNTLLELRHRPLWKANKGEHGKGKGMTGATAPPLEIFVPVGTRVFDEDTDAVLGDLTEPEQRLVVAEGGRAGRGNISFKSSTNRSPRKSTKGFPGVECSLRLELMLMADVGLLGFPNAGKSTLISRVSAAKPRVADYPFTTLTPSLGVVRIDVDNSFVMADIPGLIAGAAAGAGLGHQFLRHVSRTRMLLHLVSLGEDETIPAEERYAAIRSELEAYDPVLCTRPEVVVLTKSDLVSQETMEACKVEVSKVVGDGLVLDVSSATGQGLDVLLREVWKVLLAAETDE